MGPIALWGHLQLNATYTVTCCEVKSANLYPEPLWRAFYLGPCLLLVLAPAVLPRIPRLAKHCLRLCFFYV